MEHPQQACDNAYVSDMPTSIKISGEEVISSWLDP